MAKKTKVAVVVKDGYVMGVYSNDPTGIQVKVLDRDGMEQDGMTSNDSANNVAISLQGMQEVFTA